MAVRVAELEKRFEKDVSDQFASIEHAIDQALRARWRPGVEVAVYLGGKEVSQSIRQMIDEAYGSDWVIRQDGGANRMLCFRKRGEARFLGM